MLNLPTTALRSEALSTRSPVRPARPRVVLLQTQAEAAGAQEISRILGEGLGARGFDVHHIFLFRRTAAFDQQLDTFFCATERPTGALSLARTLGALLGHLRELKPDAVLTFQHYGNIIGAVAARLAGVPVVVANRTSAKALEPGWTRAADLAFGASGLFSSVVVNCKSIADEYVSYPRRYRERIVRIDHGFEPKRTALSQKEAREAFGLPLDVPVLGSVGRLHSTKNLGAAVELLRSRRWHLALAGQGPAHAELVALARAAGAGDRLHLIGELPARAIGAFLRSLDVFVFPSLMETFGLAVVEAAAAGLPVVANDLDVLREVLAVDGRPAALFVDASNTQEFGAAVERMLGDARLRQELTSHGAALTERYAMADMVTSYAELIDALCPAAEAASEAD